MGESTVPPELTGARVALVGPLAGDGELLAAIEASGLYVRAIGEPPRAREVIASFRPDAVLIDARCDVAAAADLCAGLRAEISGSIVLLCAAMSGEALALAERCQADTVMLLPFDAVVLRRHLARELERASDRRVAPEALRLPPLVVGSCSPMRDVWRLLLLAAQTDDPIVFTGETGTGKELLARALHRFSARRAGAFVSVNCAATSEAALDAELFGHSDAAGEPHASAFARARSGTLLLDAVHELPPALQAKLVRALQDGDGPAANRADLDVRVIAATREDLEQQVKLGRFRDDLFYRLNVFSIHLPPLRERVSDIMGLWQATIAQTAAREVRSTPLTSMAVQRLLLRHEWPGNVRELQNVARHALTVATGRSITPADLPRGFAAQPAQASNKQGGSLIGLTLKEVERAAILDTYAAVGTVTGAAAMLDISPRKIHYRLNEYKQLGFLPAKEQPAQIAEPRPPAGDDRPARVLLAEDDDDLRWALSDLLQSEGYEVLAVPDGRVFLEQLGNAVLLGDVQLPADVIVTDLRMPGLNGMQILERIRERGWRIPVVLISAYGDSEVRERAKRLGAAFLHKPLDFRALQKILAESVVH